MNSLNYDEEKIHLITKDALKKFSQDDKFIIEIFKKILSENYSNPTLYKVIRIVCSLQSCLEKILREFVKPLKLLLKQDIDEDTFSIFYYILIKKTSQICRFVSEYRINKDSENCLTNFYLLTSALILPLLQGDCLHFENVHKFSAGIHYNCEICLKLNKFMQEIFKCEEFRVNYINCLLEYVNSIDSLALELNLAADVLTTIGTKFFTIIFLRFFSIFKLDC
jgi:hypothetical protein